MRHPWGLPGVGVSSRGSAPRTKYRAANGDAGAGAGAGAGVGAVEGSGAGAGVGAGRLAGIGLLSMPMQSVLSAF